MKSPLANLIDALTVRHAENAAKAALDTTTSRDAHDITTFNSGLHLAIRLGREFLEDENRIPAAAVKCWPCPSCIHQSLTAFSSPCRDCRLHNGVATKYKAGA